MYPPRRNHTLPYALLFGLASAPSHGDVGGRPESDSAVQLYRILEREAMPSGARAAFSNLSRSLCLESASEPVRQMTEIQGVRGEEVVLVENYARCTVAKTPDCSSVVKPGVWTWSLETVLEIARLREIGRRAGYPDSAVGAELTAMEALVLANIERRLKQQTALHSGSNDGVMDTRDDRRFAFRRWRELERRFALRWAEQLTSLSPTEQAKLPIFNVHPSHCAIDVGMRFPVKSEPPGASVRFISDYDWRLCQARKLDPWNPEVCVGWAAHVQSGALLIGAYRYHAVWPGGRISRDVLRVDFLERGEEITLR